MVNFLENEKSYFLDQKIQDQDKERPNSKNKFRLDKTSEYLTLTNLLKGSDKDSPMRLYKSCSLREKKMVLEK